MNNIKTIRRNDNENDVDKDETDHFKDSDVGNDSYTLGKHILDIKYIRSTIIFYRLFLI